MLLLSISSALTLYGCEKKTTMVNNKENTGKYSLQNKLDIKENLKRTVQFLAEEIGPRGYLRTGALDRAADYIASELEQYGYAALSQAYKVKGRSYRNVFAEKKGGKFPEKIIVVGAHYDTVTGTPGADDNASGVAGMLELARLLADELLDKTVHFAAFTLEEPPFFRSRFMGSYVYAKKLRQSNADVEGMICLESIGYFTDEKSSQFYPLPFFRFLYPDRGNFITFVGNLRSRDFLDLAKSGFKTGTRLPVESISTLSVIPGVDFSDHRSFWKFGYNAFMVTDTAFYRNPYYHGEGDIPGTLDFERMADVVIGLRSSVKELAQN